MRRFSFVWAGRGSWRDSWIAWSGLCAVLSLLILVVPRIHTSTDLAITPKLRATLLHDLEQVRVIEHRPRVLNYDRGQFGQGWAMGVEPTTQRACTTRQRVLAETFATEDCGKSPGRTKLGVGVQDPYSGQQIRADEVDIDHIFPLSAAWDLGAWQWEPERRRKFANDVTLNLVAVEASINREKSDSTLSEWMPPQAEAHCAYAVRFTHIAAVYDLAITQADASIARQACGF